MEPDANNASGWSMPEFTKSWGTNHWLAAGGITLTLFFVWLTWPSSDPAASSPAKTDPSSSYGELDTSDLLVLRSELRQEIEARERLEREVSMLQARIDMLDTQTGELEHVTTPADEEDGAISAGGPRPAHRPAFDERALLDASIDPSEAERLRALWESVQMERIYLRDQAEREGWAGTARYRRELRALDASIREELSPSDYDRYLYATGKKNRARVVDVIGQSAGAHAGFSVGDRILSYDGERIFNVDELRKLSSSGDRDQTVRVEVARGNSTTVLDVPRGPIGLLLMPHHEAPR
jgi:hypothetical protein